MSLRSFRSDKSASLVLDTSVIINLLASGFAASILEALPGQAIMTVNVRRELLTSCRFGSEDIATLQSLIDQGLLRVSELGENGMLTLATLIDGSRGVDLDDGEAATIAYSIEIGACAVLDERKARRVCGQHFPTMSLSCSAELLLLPGSALKVKADHQRLAILRALQIGRMRVPVELTAQVVAIIGEDQVANCPSLPRFARANAGKKKAAAAQN
jgi:predicted nucleic acid-binding protein